MNDDDNELKPFFKSKWNTWSAKRGDRGEEVYRNASDIYCDSGSMHRLQRFE